MSVKLGFFFIFFGVIFWLVRLGSTTLTNLTNQKTGLSAVPRLPRSIPTERLWRCYNPLPELNKIPNKDTFITKKRRKFNIKKNNSL
ncbi:MAG: hypothetical protein IJA53_02990 [Spirochaetaceae bacterium]|nr:hypothetical protein [Spirochaetaceae bacterium]